jgi:hypothetical protein
VPRKRYRQAAPGQRRANAQGTGGTSDRDRRVAAAPGDGERRHRKLTPGERAAGLQEIVDSGDPLALEIFGPTVSVGEFAKFVKVMCSDHPYF